eukprot:6213109-Pleurochrysis_carterae.AAC.7
MRSSHYQSPACRDRLPPSNEAFRGLHYVGATYSVHKGSILKAARARPYTDITHSMLRVRAGMAMGDRLQWGKQKRNSEDGSNSLLNS